MNIAFVGKALDTEFQSGIITRHTSHRIIWQTSEIGEALSRTFREAPDLLLVDIGSGPGCIDVIKSIMDSCPTTILAVADDPASGQGIVFSAMGAGAIDVVYRPREASDITSQRIDDYLGKIRSIERLLKDQGGRLNGANRRDAVTRADYPLLTIGASTGGPAALASILSVLPRDFPAPVIIVQHVDEQFSANFCEWLATSTTLPVRLARAGDRPKASEVLVADSARHLVMDRTGRLAYTPDPADNPYLPSVDVFYQSLAENWKGRIVGVLLTGMGRDGAKGLRSLRDKGHVTIAQNQESCTVYGMPKAAVELNAAVFVLPLESMADKITALVNSRNGNRVAKDG
jgi:two-component system, chemotaxis family, response regulator WspF